MKKKKRNFIIKLCSLLFLGIISVTLLGSWSYDSNNDTIVSDNLINFSVDTTYRMSNGVDIAPYYHLGYSNTNDTLVVKFQWYNLDTTIYKPRFFCSINQASSPNTSIQGVITTDMGNAVMSQSSQNFLIMEITPIYQNGVYNYGYIGCLIFKWVNGTLTDNEYNDIMNADYFIYKSFINEPLRSYEPYGAVYVNGADYVSRDIYESLELDYEELYDNYQNLNDSYTSLQNDYNSLNNAYNSVESAFNQLEIDYNNLESNYNDLRSRYSTLVDEYDTLLEEKQELQQQLADLNNELALLRPYIFNSSDIVVKIGNSTNTGDNFVSTSVVSNVSSYFDVYGSFDLDSLYSNYSGFGSTYNAICFEVPNYNLMMYNVSFSFTGYPDMLYRLNYEDSVGNNLVFAQDFTDSYTDLYGFSIVSGLRNSNLWDSSQPIEYCTYSKIVFVGLNVGALNVKNLNFSSSAGYSEGFNQGYNSIKNQTDLIISRLNNQVDSLNATIDNLHTQISDLQNQLNNSVGWRPLLFAMADTPLKVVSNVLGFELFGLNLFQAFIGIITALAIIWLIRKIWK